MDWEYKSLDELGSVSRGRSKHRPRNDASLFGGEYPFVQTADVKGANLYLTKYSATYNDKGLEQSKLWKAGTLCITIAANIADTAILGIDACFPDSIMGFTPFEGVSNVKFVKYAFDMLQRDCKQISQGTAQDNLSWEKLSTIRFPAPDIKVQNKIVDYISTYDDLIENNQKQISLLEEAVQRLYKEWFVDLRFPGHEDCKVVNGVPEGWYLGRLGEIIVYHDIQRKPLSSVQREAMKGQYRYFGAAGILDFVNSYLFDGTYLLLGEDGTVITEKGRPVLQYVTGQFWVNNHAHVLTGKAPYTTEYIYMLFSLMRVSDVVTGVAQPKISQGRLSAKKVLIPTEDIVLQYQSFAKPYFDRILLLEKQNEFLKESRDRLLPKLMGRKIEV